MRTPRTAHGAQRRPFRLQDFPMKNTTRRLALAAALLVPLAAACSKETTEAASKTADSAGHDMKELGNKAVDAAKQVPAQLEELRKSAEKKLSGADATLADLQAKAATKGAEVQKDLEALGQQISAKKAELSKAISDVDWKAASADAYDAAKAKIEALATELTQLVERAKAKLG
jgi:hypothetical protein